METPESFRYLPTLHLIAGIKTVREREHVLRILAKQKPFLNFLREIAINLQTRNISVDAKQISKLSKHKRIIVGLSKPKIGRARGISLAEQSGGFLNILVPILAAAVGGLIQNASA